MAVLMANGVISSFGDYVTIVPSTAAVVITFIAVLIAQFFKDSHRAKVILVGIAALLSVAAIAATIYGQHLVIAQRQAYEAQQQAEKKNRETIVSALNDARVTLARLIASKIETEADFQEFEKRRDFTIVGIERSLKALLPANQVDAVMLAMPENVPATRASGFKGNAYVWMLILEKIRHQLGDLANKYRP